MAKNFPDLEDVSFDFGWGGDVKQMIHDLIWIEGLHQKLVGRLLGIERSTVARLMKQYGIQSNLKRAGAGRCPRQPYSGRRKFA